MKKVFSKVINTSKILLLVALILATTKVNTFTTNGKISNASMNKTLDLFLKFFFIYKIYDRI